jgi:hypothetical protein
MHTNEGHYGCCRYWLMCAGDESYASGNSLVGSIGVITAGLCPRCVLHLPAVDENGNCSRDGG